MSVTHQDISKALRSPVGTAAFGIFPPNSDWLLANRLNLVVLAPFGRVADFE